MAYIDEYYVGYHFIYPSHSWATFTPKVVTESWYKAHKARKIMRQIALEYSE